MTQGFFRHLHPARLSETRISFSETFCLGGAAFFFFVVLVVTGALLMFFYLPLPSRAPTSIADIDSAVPFGRLLRSLHYVSAQLMLVAVLLHMTRVVLTRAYLPPRRLNWVIGVTLFLTVSLLDFSGYVLRWDEQGRLAGLVGWNLLRNVPLLGHGATRVLLGSEPETAMTLLRWYAWHCVGLPLLLSGLCTYHFWRIRKDGWSRAL